MYLTWLLYLLYLLFLCQQSLFTLGTPVIATDAAILSYNAVTGNDNSDWISGTRLGNGTGLMSITQRLGNLAI